MSRFFSNGLTVAIFSFILYFTPAQAEYAAPQTNLKLGNHRQNLLKQPSATALGRVSSHKNLSHKDLGGAHASSAAGEKDFVIVLSVDGGGIRGIVPAILVDKIEKSLGQPVSKAFDAFGGTSAGAIIVSILNKINPATKQPFSGEDLVHFIQGIGENIFARPLSRMARTALGGLGSKYSAKPLEAFLQEKLGTTKISESLKPLTIVAYDFTYKKAFLFLSRSKQTHNADYNLWETVRASTAAPVLFKGHEMVIGGHKRTMVDGAIGGGMSPDLYLYDEVKKLYPGKKIFFVSLATGQDKNPTTIRGKGRSAGSIPLVLEQTIVQSLESTIDQGKMILSKAPEVEYHRIDVHLPPDCSYQVDDPRPKNVQCLTKVANEFAAKPAFQKMIDRLKSVMKGEKVKGGSVQAIQEDEFSNPNLPASVTAKSLQTEKKKWYHRFQRKKKADSVD